MRTRPKYSEEEVFVLDSNVSPVTTKNYFIKKMIRLDEYKCKICFIFEWQGKFITLQIDHIDGNNRNNELLNLRLICPTCHSQTSNFSGANSPRVKNKGKLTNSTEKYHDRWREVDVS